VQLILSNYRSLTKDFKHSEHFGYNLPVKDKLLLKAYISIFGCVFIPLKIPVIDYFVN